MEDSPTLPASDAAYAPAVPQEQQVVSPPAPQVSAPQVPAVIDHAVVDPVTGERRIPIPRKRIRGMMTVRVTDECWKNFIESLRKTGILEVAVLQAKPHLIKADGSGHVAASIATFVHAIERSPAMKAEYEDALAEGVAFWANEAMKAAMRPDTRPIISSRGGVLRNEDGTPMVEERWESSNRMKKMILARLDGRWADTKNIKGEVTHQHTVGLSRGDGVFFSHNEIAMLEEADQRLLYELYDKIEQAKAMPSAAVGQLAGQLAADDILEGEIIDAATS